jgi:hypothetical protein
MVESTSANPPTNPAVSYERSDVNLRKILYIVGAIIVGAVIIHIIVMWFLLGYDDRQAEVKRSRFPLAGERITMPPEPRLEQIDRQEGIAKVNVYERREKKEEEGAYHTTDEPGVVRIPVARAMKLLENKLPVRKEPAGAGKREEGLVDWGEPNSGRLLRGK